MRVAIAGAGSVGPLDRPRAARERPRGPARSTRTPRAIKPERGARGRVAARRRLRGLLARGGRPATSCDVVIAATGDDKVNLVISLLAKTEFGVPRTVARVNHPKNEWLFNEAWGVDVAVSTPRHHVRAGRGGGQRRRPGAAVHLPAGRRQPGRADPARRLARSSATRVGDVPWPPDTALVTILRDGRSIAPSPDDPLEAGDELLFVATADMGPALEELLAPHDAADRARRLRRRARTPAPARRRRRRRRRP